MSFRYPHLRPVNLRGVAYYTELKRILAEIGPAIIADAEAIKAATGTITPVGVAGLALKHNLNFKATCEWLEEQRFLRYGTYDRIRASLKISDLLDEAAKRAEVAE